MKRGYLRREMEGVKARDFLFMKEKSFEWQKDENDVQIFLSIGMTLLLCKAVYGIMRGGKLAYKNCKIMENNDISIGNK